MKRRMSVVAISVLLLLALGTGCIGNFGLVGKVRKFNLDVSKDRWGREIDSSTSSSSTRSSSGRGRIRSMEARA